MNRGTQITLNFVVPAKAGTHQASPPSADPQMDPRLRGGDEEYSS
jgi:hypothetical protein